MSIKQIETLVAFIGMAILCGGVGAMLVTFWIGAAIIAVACLLIFGAGVLIPIRDRRKRRQQAPAAPEWDTYKAVDHDLPPWLSDAELEMLRANKLITRHRWPANQYHDHPLDLGCREER